MLLVLLSASSCYAGLGAYLIIDNVTTQDITLNDGGSSCLVNSDALKNIQIAPNQASNIYIEASTTGDCLLHGGIARGLLALTATNSSGQASVAYTLSTLSSSASSVLKSNNLPYSITTDHASSLHNAEIVIRVTPNSEQSQVYSNWMGTLSTNPQFANQKLAQTLLPGSHDSFSYGLTSADICNTDPNALSWLKIVGAMGLNWSMAQPNNSNFMQNTFINQLNHGVRYFDVRLCYQNNTNFNSHNYLTHDSFEQNIAELTNFSSAHPQEIIILDLNHAYGFDSTSMSNLLDYLHQNYANIIVPFTQANPGMTLQQLWALHKNLIIILPSQQADVNFDYLRNNPRFTWVWPSTTINSPWPDLTDYPQLLSFAEQQLLKRNQNQLFVSQLQQTPSLDYILENLRSSLFALNYASLQAAYSWLKNNEAAVNIYIRDYEDAYEGVNLNLLRFGFE